MNCLKAMDMGRNISCLPDPILHHILSSLSQKDAVKTCVLSKSWRFLSHGRPNVVFYKDRFKGTVKEFISVLDQTLVRYNNQNLPIQKFILKMPAIGPVSAPFLEKWIPFLVMQNKGMETFHLFVVWKSKSEYFDMPSIVFLSESIREIKLEGFKLNQINSTEKVNFRHLQTLRLLHVKVEEETFERILSSSPLIQHVSLYECEGLETVKVNNHYCSLKSFMFKSCEESRIEIADVSSIKTINLKSCRDWFEHHCYHKFTHLKSLHLSYFDVTTKSLDIFSCNFPCLEELKLGCCFGTFEEFQLSSSSIKRLAIKLRIMNASITIDAPNILEFEYQGYDFPPHISFTTTSNKWKSNIVLETYLDDSKMAFSQWLHELDELLKVLSESETSLHILIFRREDDWRFLCDPYYPTQEIVKHLELCLGSLCSDFSVRLEVEGEPTQEWNSYGELLATRS